MTKERASELRELLFNLEKRIAPLEWDFNRNQINEFKKVELGRLREEHKTLLQELSDLEQQH
jgi:hypothetical protein